MVLLLTAAHMEDDDMADFLDPDAFLEEPSQQSLDASPASSLQQNGASSTWALVPAAAAVEEDSAARLQQAVMLHALYPRLLEAITSCRKVGQPNRQEIVELDNRCRRAKAEVAAARDAAFRQQGCLPPEVSDPELQEYLTRYIAAAEQHRAQLAALYQDVEAAARNMEVQVNQLLCGGGATGSSSGSPVSKSSQEASAPRAAAVSGATASGAHSTSSAAARGDTSGSATSFLSGTSSRDEQTEALRSMLKRQYADTISALQEEFTRKRSKGKLPKNATSTLRDWWNKHYTWPYPKEEEKDVLSQSSGLAVSQVNNWFINQRKRHWHKLFLGYTPTNEQEATQYLRSAGHIV